MFVSLIFLSEDSFLVDILTVVLTCKGAPSIQVTQKSL